MTTNYDRARELVEKSTGAESMAKAQVFATLAVADQLRGIEERLIDLFDLGQVLSAGEGPA